MSTTTHLHSRQEIYDWLNRQAKERGIEITLLTHQAKLYEERLYLPVYIANSTNAYDDSVKLQELESTWNFSEADLHPRIFLLPSDDKPNWLEAHAPVQQAKDRYYDAFDAFRAAGSSEEAQEALKDMEAAKMAELEAAKQLDHAA